MTDVKSQRRIAAKILKIGKNRVKIDPDSLQDLSLAITREDIRGHIDTGMLLKKEKDKEKVLEAEKDQNILGSQEKHVGLITFELNENTLLS